VRKKGGGGSERHYIKGGGEQETLFLSLVLKVPKQCPLVLLVEVLLREGEYLGSEKIKF
jgi:hypothetical protein